MTRMFPYDEKLVSANRPRHESLGESRVFQALRDAPATSDWMALYSVSLIDESRQCEDEIDFVVLIPGRAIVVVEVKGDQHPPQPDGQNWLFGKEHQHIKRNPYDQAKGQEAALRERLRAAGDRLGRLPVVSMVCFPFLSWNRLPTSKADQWRTLAGDDIGAHGIGEQIIENLDLHIAELRRKVATPEGERLRWLLDLHESGHPTHGECERIARVLRPAFALAADRGLEMNRLDLLLERLSAEQRTAEGLALSEADRVIVTGPAGSGKTILALDVARRHANSGARVLYVCANENLASWARGELGVLPSSLVIESMRGLLLDYCGMTPPSPETDGFWRRTAPEVALNHAMEREGFDELVVDDAQDLFFHEDSEGVALQLQFLGELLRGGWSSGKWRVFGDAHQSHLASWKVGRELPPWLGNEEFRGPERDFVNAFFIAGCDQVTLEWIELFTNYRNPPDLWMSLDRWGEVLNEWDELETARVEDEGNQPDALEPGFEIRYIERPERRVEHLEMLLTELLSEGYSPADIAVLSDAHWPDLQSAALVTDSELSRLLQPLMPGVDAPDSVRYASVADFRGLESHVVILTDVMLDAWSDPTYLDKGYFRPFIDYDRAIVARPGEYLQTTLYAALTRATHRAVAILPDVLRLALWEAMHLDTEGDTPPFPWWHDAGERSELLYERDEDGVVYLTTSASERMPIPIVVGPFERPDELRYAFWDKHYPSLHLGALWRGGVWAREFMEQWRREHPDLESGEADT